MEGGTSHENILNHPSLFYSMKKTNISAVASKFVGC